jgi:hypothetical protein
MAFSVVTNLKTLMIGVDQLLVDDVGKDQSELARFGHVTPAPLSLTFILTPLNRHSTGAITDLTSC